MFLRALSGWCVRHRAFVVVIWLVILVAVTGASRAVGSTYSSNFSLPNTPSAHAAALLRHEAPSLSGDTEEVVLATHRGLSVEAPSVRTRFTHTLDELSKLPGATRVVSPYSSAGHAQVSRDGRIAFATLTFDRLAKAIPTSESLRMVRIARGADGPGVTVAVAGQVAEQSNPQSIGGSAFGIVFAGVVLLLVFGSVFAMVLPLISALASLGTAVGLIALLSHLLLMPNFSTELVLLIGLGVGVDYALFIVTRHRQGLIAGKDVGTAIVDAVDTSGRAVLFAGVIVCVALLGMAALGISILDGLAVAAALGVALTMVTALTLLPALLSFIGPRVMSTRQKRELAERGPRIVGTGTVGFWPRWAHFIRRHPLLPALAALVVVVGMALPFLSMRLGTTDQGSDPLGTTTRTAYDLLSSGFGPGFNGPLELVATGHGNDRRALTRLAGAVRGQAGVARVAPPVHLPSRDGTDVALITAYPATSPQSGATAALIGRLRSEAIPAATAGTDLHVDVGGETATFVDFAAVLSGKLPLFIALVVGVSFLLLAVAFRSLLIPLTAAVMNLLSIGAAFGVVTAVFQWGWFGSIIGTGGPGPVEAFLPVMLFAILFGLSMDYEVFLVTRIHEEWLRCRDTKQAVSTGLAATGKTVTAAALIMILVFGAFLLGGQEVIKEFGVGLAVGIFVDAVIIRMTTVPALMQLSGAANWWFPAALDRVLPRVSVEPPDHGIDPADPRGARPAPAPGPERDRRADRPSRWALLRPRSWRPATPERWHGRTG